MKIAVVVPVYKEPKFLLDIAGKIRADEYADKEFVVVVDGAMTAEIAEGWQPVFFLPEKADDVWGDALRAGAARRDPALGRRRGPRGRALMPAACGAMRRRADGAGTPRLRPAVTR